MAERSKRVPGDMLARTNIDSGHKIPENLISIPLKFQHFYSGNPYEVLGLLPNASAQEVEHVKSQLWQKYHPDLFDKDPVARPFAEDIFKRVGQAAQNIRERKPGSPFSAAAVNNVTNVERKRLTADDFREKKAIVDIRAGAGGIKSTRELGRFARLLKPIEGVLLVAILAGLAGEIKAKEMMDLVQEEETVSGPRSFDAGAMIDVDEESQNTDRSLHFEAATAEHQRIQLIKEFLDNVKQNLANQGYKVGESSVRIFETVGVDAQGVKGQSVAVSDAKNQSLLEKRALEAEVGDEKEIEKMGGEEGFGSKVEVESRSRDMKILIVNNADGSVRGEMKNEYYQKLGVTQGQADKFFHWKNNKGKGAYKKLSAEQIAGLEAINQSAMRETLTTAEILVKVGIEAPGQTETVWTTHNKKVLVIDRKDGDHRWLEIVPLVDSEVAERPLVQKKLHSKRPSVQIPIAESRDTGVNLSRSRRTSYGGRGGGNIGGIR